MLTVQTIADSSQLEALIPEWDRLDRSLSPRSPFTSPLWCLTWWKHFRRDGFLSSDHLRIYFLRDETGELIGVAPMFITHRPGRGLIRARELQFFGADPYVSEIRGPICRPESVVAVILALSAHIRAEAECDWVQWRGLRLLEEVEDDRLPIRTDSKLSTIDYFLEVPDCWDAFRRALPRNIKESLRKCYNSLKRENHAFELRVIDSPRETPAALDQFLTLHRMRAEKSETVEHGDVFENARARAFLREYCAALAERGDLRVFQLLIQERVVATRIGFALGGELYLYFSGYDVEWGRFSVMTTTVAETIKWAIERSFRIVNLSTGADVSKTRWRPNHVVYHGGYSVCPAATSRLAFNFVEMLRDH